MISFDSKILECFHGELRSEDMKVIQANLGFLCNLSCNHCHLQASPKRIEIMERETMLHILNAIEKIHPEYIDLTGGSPEMNPYFEWFIARIRSRDISVWVRTNLTVLRRPEYRKYFNVFKKQKIRLLASLPCYTEENVNKQRGLRVFEESIEVLQKLNELGYGKEEDLVINLIFNPGGPSLPGLQHELEQEYKKVLKEQYDIVFNDLLTITNVMIGRFESELEKMNKTDEYATLLYDAFNPSTISGLMCRHQLNIGWDGTLYDCDFNLALNLPIEESKPQNIRDFDLDAMKNRRIMTGPHCYTCTAGSGSSCSGSLV